MQKQVFENKTKILNIKQKNKKQKCKYKKTKEKAQIKHK